MTIGAAVLTAKSLERALNDVNERAFRVLTWLIYCDECGCLYGQKPGDCPCDCHKEEECTRS